MASDQGYPVQEYTNLENDVVWKLNSDGKMTLISGAVIASGTGSPEGVVTSNPGGLYIQIDGVAPNVWWQKQTGSGNTGWALVTAGAGTPPGGNDTDVQFNNAGSFDGTDNFIWRGINGLGVIGEGVAVEASADLADTASTTTVAGLFTGAINNTAPRAATKVMGVGAQVSIGGGGFLATITDVDVLEASIDCGPDVDITTLAMLEVAPIIDPSALITNFYGLHIADVTGVPASGSLRAIKVDGNAVSEFGTLKIQDGLINDPAQDLQVVGNGASLTLSSGSIALTDPSGAGLSTNTGTDTVTLSTLAGTSLAVSPAAITMGGLGEAPSLKVFDVAAAAGAGEVTFGNETGTTVGAAGGASALPATPAGYLRINVGGTHFKIPYYTD